jgi:deoxyribodipyrimidine photo-lyase
MDKAIWWIRRDLRLADNQALASGLREARSILPVFILDPKLLNIRRPAQKRIGFMFAGLRALDADLRVRGAQLVILQGEPAQVLSMLVQSTGCERIYAEADPSPYARQRDAAVAGCVPLTLTPGISFHCPQEVVKADGSPYTVFTPYRRAWQALPSGEMPLPAPGRLPMLEQGNGQPSPTLPEHTLSGLFPAGEAEAARRLDDFIRLRVQDYHLTRDRMDLDGTSSLSPYLRFGMLSTRQVIWATEQARLRLAGSGMENGAETWLNELIWREFYQSILYHFPFVRRMAFRAQYRTIQWRNADAEFDAWCHGRTGYPVVDAAMRQLLSTGWMHNRARMISASFLAKHLLIDWRQGERWFMENLLDGDLASNNGGWQWTAGTGTDAAPYFRVFNPTLQGQKFDPRGDYIRRHVPELELVPDEHIHEPWKMSVQQQLKFGCMIGKDYPTPIVEHAFARQRALQAYHGG